MRSLFQNEFILCDDGETAMVHTEVGAFYGTVTVYLGENGDWMVEVAQDLNRVVAIPGYRVIALTRDTTQRAPA